MPTCCVLVLTYNGRQHLESCLPSLMGAAGNVAGGCPVVVVDNRSTDRSVEWLHQHYPQIEVQIADRNDYLFSLNQVVASRAEDIVVILNNDMHFDEGFISALLPHFDSPDVFAATARILNWEGNQLTTGQRVGEKRHAWFYKSWQLSVQESCLTLDACGGGAAFRRSMYLELGGFDRLYHPGYCEDTDLSYRAWRRGWKVVYEPSSTIYHRMSASFSEQNGSRSALTCLIRRNEVIFTVRNVGGWGFVTAYLALLPVRMVRNAMMNNHALWKGALRALPRIPAALARRAADRHWHSDDEFLDEIRHCTTAEVPKRAHEYERSEH